MEWYIPITIIPGIGLIIQSTSNIILDLNNEITELKNGDIDLIKIIIAKISQLKVLSIAIVFQYMGVLLFLLSGIMSSILNNDYMSKNTLILGVFLIALSIIMLLYYHLKAITIRQNHLKSY